MVKYSQTPETPAQAAKAKGSFLRVHFKNIVEVAAAVRGKTLERAKSYLQNVLEHKEAIPILKSKGGRGRHSQAKNLHVPGALVFWPKAATEHVLGLLTNAEANAEAKGLDVSKLVVSHSQANQAPKGRRRTYRAHGRIGPYLRQPSHVELILTSKPETVEKPEEKAAVPRLHVKKLARRTARVPVGGGATA